MSSIVFRPRKSRKYVDLNVTSLVDVLFLLLIFFTLTSTFKRAGEIELDLPSSTTAGPAGSTTTTKPLQVVLTAHGTLLLDGAPTTMDRLLPSLREASQREPNREVSIEAEEHVEHGKVVQLLDAVRTAGFRGVSIGVHSAGPASSGATR